MVQTVGFLQAKHGKASKMAKAQTMIAGLASTYKSKPLSLLAYSMRIQLKTKTQNFGMLMGMIDNMVKILGDEQGEDDKHKEFCSTEFDKAADEDAAAKDKAAAEEATITEVSDAIATIGSDVAALTEQIKELDKSVATATETQTLNEAANALVEKAKQRLYKFYNPNLYVAPAKKELSMEDSLYVKGGRSEFAEGSFVQIKSHSRLQEPVAPETFSGIQQPKSEKST